MAKKESLKEIYNKVNTSPNSQIVGIKNKTTLISNMANYLSNNKFGLIIGFLVYLIILTWLFYKIPKIIFISLGVVLSLFILYFISSTYQLKMLEKSMILKRGSEKTNIDYNSLFTILLSYEKYRLLLMPLRIYSLNIFYIEKDELKALSLPIVMLKRSALLKFMNSFDFQIDEELEKEASEELKSKEKKILKFFSIFGAIIILFIIISAIMFMFNKKG